MGEAAAATAVSLPEDVVREILLLVEDTSALFRCGLTCKRWSRLVSDASFLLVRLDDPGSAPFSYRYRLAVCNLVAGVCDVLPSPSHYLDFSKSGYAIVTSADYSSSLQSKHHDPLLLSSSSSSSSPGDSTFFKVLILGMSMYNGRHPNLYAFSSSEARWSKPTEISFHPYVDIPNCKHTDAVVSRGKVHWRVGSWSIDYSLDVVDANISRTMIPLYPSRYFGASSDEPLLRVTANGTLSVLLLSRPGLELEVRTRQNDEMSGDGATTRWLRADTTTWLKPPSRHIVQIRPMPTFLRLLGEKSGTMLLKDSKRRLYIADLETGVMEELTNCFDGLNRQKVVLLEMDWPALFVSRLGRW